MGRLDLGRTWLWRTKLWRTWRRHPAAREQQHPDTEDQHGDSPPEVHIDAQRVGVVHFAALRGHSVSANQQTEHGEHQADWQSDVESHADSSRHPSVNPIIL